MEKFKLFISKLYTDAFVKRFCIFLMLIIIIFTFSFLYINDNPSPKCIVFHYRVYYKNWEFIKTYAYGFFEVLPSLFALKVSVINIYFIFLLTVFVILFCICYIFSLRALKVLMIFMVLWYLFIFSKFYYFDAFNNVIPGLHFCSIFRIDIQWFWMETETREVLLQVREYCRDQDWSLKDYVESPKAIKNKHFPSVIMWLCGFDGYIYDSTDLQYNPKFTEFVMSGNIRIYWDTL